MSLEIELLKALQRFEPRITFDAMEVDSSIFDEVIAKNIKITYYLEEVSCSPMYFFGPQILFKVKYKNTEVSHNDIYIVSSEEEVHSILCQYIGNYKSRLVLYAKPEVDVRAEYDKFSETDTPFYANYTGARIKIVNSSASPMPYYDFYFNYRIGKVKLAMMESEMDAEIERIAKQLFLPSMPNETKAFLAHNYLASTIDYTLKDDANALEKSYQQSAYGALIKKKCVCQGYAEAFKRLMDYEEIPCDIICGKIKDSSTYHAWNILKLNNEQDNYHIDVTWDSEEWGVSYDYFGLKDSDFLDKRTWNKEFNAKCNSNKSLLIEAKRGLIRFKSQLIANGVSMRVLGY